MLNSSGISRVTFDAEHPHMAALEVLLTDRRRLARSIEAFEQRSWFIDNKLFAEGKLAGKGLDYVIREREAVGWILPILRLAQNVRQVQRPSGGQ